MTQEKGNRTCDQQRRRVIQVNQVGTRKSKGIDILVGFVLEARDRGSGVGWSGVQCHRRRE